MIIYKTNFFKQLWENPEVNQFFLTITLICTGFQITVFCYLTIYGPLVLRRELDMEKDMPNMIPVMTGVAVAIFFCLIASTWPVWGFLTPIYMLILFFGSSFSMMFLPSGTFGTFCFWLIFGVGGYFAHNMPHEAVW